MKIERLVRILILSVSFATLLISASDLPGKKVRRPDENKVVKAKSRYYYLEGVRHAVEGRDAEAYENFKHAWRLDPSNRDAAYHYGLMRVQNHNDTLWTPTEQEKTMALMRPYVDAYPGNYDEGIYYAYLARQFDFPEEAIRIYERSDSLSPSRTGTLLYLADAYFSQGEDEKGMNALNRYERIEGKTPNLTLKKISYLINRRDTVGAIREASALVASDPREPAYLILKGNLFQLVGRKDSVESYFRRAEEIAPGYGAAKLSLADFYLQEGDSARYDEKIYEALLAEDFGLEEKTGLLSEYLARLLYDKSDTSRGDYLFSVLEKQYPFEVEVTDLAARYNAAKGDYEKALEQIEHALDLNQNNERYWGQKMSYLISLDRWNEALETYDEAITHVEPTTGLRTIYAAAAQIGKDYPKAIRMYGELINELAPGIDPTRELEASDVPRGLNLEGLEQLSALFTTIGDCYMNMEQNDMSFMEYENALKIDPENALALNNYAYFLEESGGDLEKCAALSERSLRGDNADNPTYLDTYAWILYKQGKAAEALEYQKRAIDNSAGTSAESVELWEHYGDILLENGDRKGAVDAWEKALEMSEDKSELTKKINENK